MEASCPICGGATVLHCEKGGAGRMWEVRRCAECGHGFTANRPSLEELKEMYHADSGEVRHIKSAEDYERHTSSRRVAETICRLTPLRGRSLDVGAGGGSYSYHLAKRGFQPLMIDLDPRLEEAARRVQNATFRCCAFEEIDEPGAFAAIVMSQVLEHSLDPMDWLRRAKGLLQPGGVLSIGVPNFAGPYRVLGAKDPLISPPFHLNQFTARSLELAVGKAGMRVLKVAGDNEVTIHSGGVLKRVVMPAVWNTAAVALNRIIPRNSVILQVYATVG